MQRCPLLIVLKDIQVLLQALESGNEQVVSATLKSYLDIHIFFLENERAYFIWIYVENSF